MAHRMTSQITVEIGTGLFSLPTERTVELADLGGRRVISMPGCLPTCAGVIEHRSVVIPAVDMRSALGFDTFEQRIDELRAMLASREQDHIDWLTELRRCCSSGEAFTKPTDPHQCKFGRWYDELHRSQEAMDELTVGDRSIRVIVDALDIPHQRIHGIAKEALELAGGGSLAEAESIIQHAWDTDLGSLKRSFDQLIDAVAARQQPRMVVVQLDGDRLGLLVDDVVSIDAFDPAAVQPVDLVGSRSPLIGGVFVHEKRGHVLMLDLDELRRTLRGRVPSRDDVVAAAA